MSSVKNIQGIWLMQIKCIINSSVLCFGQYVTTCMNIGFNIVVLYSVIVYFTQYRKKPKPETPSITEYSQYYAFI